MLRVIIRRADHLVVPVVLALAVGSSSSWPRVPLASSCGRGFSSVVVFVFEPLFFGTEVLQAHLVYILPWS